MSRGALAVLFTVLSLSPGHAQITDPIRFTWIVESCDAWNHAVAALVMANGEASVVVLATGREERPWLILKRVEEGSIYIPETEPYTCEVFDTITSASSRLTTLPSCQAPLILTVPDGRVVVVSLQKCTDARPKRRAAN